MAAQTESTPTRTYEKIKEWLAFASIIVVVAGGLLAGVLGVMKLAIAPLETDVRAIHDRLDRMISHLQGLDDRMSSQIQGLDEMSSQIQGVDDRMSSQIQGVDNSTQSEFRAIHDRFDRMDSRLGGLEHTMQNGFKAVRQDLSAFSERLIRVETLLEQVISQPDVPQ